MKIIRAIMLALYWELPRHKNQSFAFEQGIERQFERNQRKKKIRQRRYTPKWKLREMRRTKIHQGYRKSSPRDARFSDQQKLRRMYRNS